MIHFALPNQDPTREVDGFQAVDLPLPAKDMNAAEIILTARYPAEKFAINIHSEMIVRVLEGEVIFHMGDKKAHLQPGMTVYVPKNRKYYWDPTGPVRLFAVSSPPWSKDQHDSAS